MSEESIFDAPATSEGGVTPQVPQVPQELVELVGEGKKYRSVEDALKSVPHAQSHIKKLEEELAMLKEEVIKRKTAEELLDSFKSASQQEVSNPQPALDQDTLVQTVEAVLSQAEQKKSAQANIQSVINKFTELYGEKGSEVYSKLAQESGIPLASLNQLAATSPNAVFKLAGMDQQKPSVPGKTSSSVNTQALQQTQTPPANSAKVPKGATTKDLVSAWRNAGATVKQNLGIE